MLTRRHITAALLAGLAMPVIRRAKAAEPGDLRRAIQGLDQLHAMVVWRGDEVVFAEARRGPGLERIANIKSCSKSIVALLLGAAIDRGEIEGVQASLGDVAPRIIPAKATDGVAEITMQDLVTLRAGLAPTSGRNYGAWVGSRDWLAYALREPMVAEPGRRMIYSTGTTHILGAALAKATGDSLLVQARERLGQPLGIDIPAWTRDPQGFYLGGNEMAMTPHAMAKIALLMRDGGRHDGRQVISGDWIRDSWVARTRSPYSGLDYGYGWFLSRTGYAIARGYGGQIIAANPQAGLAVAITSDTDRPARSEGYFGTLMDLLNGPVLDLA